MAHLALGGFDHDLGATVAAQIHDVCDRLPTQVTQAVLVRYGFFEPGMPQVVNVDQRSTDRLWYLAVSDLGEGGYPWRLPADQAVAAHELSCHHPGGFGPSSAPWAFAWSATLSPPPDRYNGIGQVP
jgi:hypothetical protein